MNTKIHFVRPHLSVRSLLKAAVFLTIFLLFTVTPLQTGAQSARVCDPQQYEGVLHCSDNNGETQLLIVDLNNPNVRIQTVFPTNERNEECNSVNANNHPSQYSQDTSSNCSYLYPRDKVKTMLERYRSGFRVSGSYADFEPVAVINTDYFGTDGDHGAQGLAVRNGYRLDGSTHNDYDLENFVPQYRGSTAPSLAFSQFPPYQAVIGIPGTEETINQHLTDIYFNVAGGGPIIVGGSKYGNEACSSAYPGMKCADIGQSAVGLTVDKRLVLITAKTDAKGLADYLTQHHSVTKAMKFDGGGSASLAWVDSNGDVQDYYPDPDLTPRRVAEGLLVLSKKLPPTGNIDVALIIDSSGSMTSNDPENKRLAAGRAYLSASLEGDYVGVVDFDGYARLASPLLRLPDNKSILTNAINSINSSGSTNLGLGLQEGCNALINSSSLNTKKGAIFLTDGEGNYRNEATCFSDRGWKIYAFGLGSADDNLLTEIATSTGGEYSRLPTSALICEFLRVRSKISGVAPGPCNVHRIGPLEVIIFRVTVTSSQQISFSTSWPGSDVEMALVSPSGRVIDRNTIAPDVVHELEPTFEVYTILSPEVGDWEVKLLGADVPAEGEDVVFGFTSIPRVLSYPTKVSPVGNAFLNSPVTLTWTNFDNAVRYEYCVVTKAAQMMKNECKKKNKGWVSTGTNTNVSLYLKGFNPRKNKWYYWQVRALLPDGTYVYAEDGQWWKFSVIKQKRPRR